MSNTKTAIKQLEATTPGLNNDARYWELRRTYGDYSREVLRHLQACAEQRRASR